MEDNEVGHHKMHEEEMEQIERKEKLHEFKKYLFVIVKTILCVLNELILDMQCSLSRQLITSSKYEYTNKILNEDPEYFRQVYKMYFNVFLKLWDILREKTPLHDTKFICVKEMLTVFLLIIGQNSRYC